MNDRGGGAAPGGATPGVGVGVGVEWEVELGAVLEFEFESDGSSLAR